LIQFSILSKAPFFILFLHHGTIKAFFYHENCRQCGYSATGAALIARTVTGASSTTASADRIAASAMIGLLPYAVAPDTKLALHVAAEMWTE
jgi:hypothetical protein